MSRVKDPELLARLKPIWREWGCGVCGYSVPSDQEPPAGTDVELNHVELRGQGGDDVPENIIGMCGELTDRKCHHRFHQHRLHFKVNGAGQLVWMSTEPGGHTWSPVRIPPEVEAMIAPADGGSDGAWVVPVSEPSGGEVAVVTAVDPIVVEVLSPVAPTGGAVSHTPAPVSAPARYERLTILLRRSRSDMIEAAMHLHIAWRDREYEALGTDWATYYSGLGLEKSAVSKMLRVAQAFASSWDRLPESDRVELSVERLYLAARLVDHEQLDPDAAIAEAVANPTHQLVARLRGDEPAAKCKCTCPNCGKELFHDRKGADE